MTSLEFSIVVLGSICAALLFLSTYTLLRISSTFASFRREYRNNQAALEKILLHLTSTILERQEERHREDRPVSASSSIPGERVP